MTEEFAARMIKAVLDVHPDLSKAEIKLMKEQLAARIENKDLREFNIHFKGGSKRIIVPATSHKLSLDIDFEGKRVRNIFEGIDGKITEVII